MQKFNTQKELHDYIRSLHGKGTEIINEIGKELYELSGKDPESYFGEWGFDYGGCSHALGLEHVSSIDGYDYTFWFMPDGSDTVERDTVYDENGNEVLFLK